MHSNSDLFWVSCLLFIDMCCMTGDSHCFTEEEDDMVHTVSISGIFTWIQYNSEIDQDSAVLMFFLWLCKSSALNNKNLDVKNLNFGAKPLWHQKQTLINTSWVEPVLNIPNYFIITLHIAFSLPCTRSIVRYCFRSAPLFHFCITYCFSYAMCLKTLILILSLSSSSSISNISLKY
jgi:hypothetical protein